jgi:hypothetical protein
MVPLHPCTHVPSAHKQAELESSRVNEAPPGTYYAKNNPPAEAVRESQTLPLPLARSGAKLSASLPHQQVPYIGKYRTV